MLRGSAIGRLSGAPALVSLLLAGATFWIPVPLAVQEPGTLPHWENLTETERKYLSDVGELDGKAWAAPTAGPEDPRILLLEKARKEAPERRRAVLGLVDALTLARSPEERARALADLDRNGIDEGVLQIWLPGTGVKLLREARETVRLERAPGPDRAPGPGEAMTRAGSRFEAPHPSPQAAKIPTLKVPKLSPPRKSGLPSMDPPEPPLASRSAGEPDELKRRILAQGIQPGPLRSLNPFKKEWRVTQSFFLAKEDAKDLASKMGVGRTEEGWRVLERLPGGKALMAYFELDEKTQALTYPPNPLLGGTVTILVNTTVKGSPAERYILQHELHHAGSDPSLGQMEREYAGHLSAIRSFVEEHPEFLKGFDALKIANKDRYVAQLYFQARIWADRLTDGTFPSMSPLIRECDKLKEREVLPDKSPLCEKVRSAILGDSERGHSPCRLSEPCGGYPGLFYIINRNYEGSGESLRMDQPSQAWLKEEIKGDLEFRSRHRYDMKTKR